MLVLFFFFNILILLFFWWVTFTSKLWKQTLPVQILLFIMPILFGLLTLVLISNIFSLEIIKLYRYYVYLYSSISLLLLIPQWYKLAWTQLLQTQKKTWSDSTKLIAAVIFAILMVLAMVLFFALYYLWIYSIGGNSQGLLTALTNYQKVDLDFFTAFYFSFVTYFTLGYGDLIPYGFWMQTFVFIECLVAVVNTGIIAIYVYNFLFHNNYPENKNYSHRILKKI